MNSRQESRPTSATRGSSTWHENQAMNPYAPPQSLAPPMIVVAQQAEVVAPIPIYVDGDDLIVPNGATLPRFCVKTGEPVTQPEMRDDRLIARRYEFFHPQRAVCQIRYGITPAIARRHQQWQLALLVSIGMFFILCCWMATLDVFHWFGGWSASIGLSTSFIMLLYLPPILRAKPHESGGFRISGCGRKFLDRIREA